VNLTTFVAYAKQSRTILYERDWCRIVEYFSSALSPSHIGNETLKDDLCPELLTSGESAAAKVHRTNLHCRDGVILLTDFSRTMEQLEDVRACLASLTPGEFMESFESLHNLSFQGIQADEVITLARIDDVLLSHENPDIKTFTTCLLRGLCAIQGMGSWRITCEDFLNRIPIWSRAEAGEVEPFIIKNEFVQEERDREEKRQKWCNDKSRGKPCTTCRYERECGRYGEDGNTD